MENKTGICQSCEKPLRGRSDKKFCNDYCRHLHHNKNRTEEDGSLKRINSILRRNRQILRDIVIPPEEPVRLKREDLTERGFVFRYYTHEKRSRTGSVYKYCYDYGYLPLENDYYLLIKEI